MRTGDPISVETAEPRLSLGLALADRPGRTTIVDVGVARRPPQVSEADSGASILVTRGCYLALDRARDLDPDHVGSVVLVDEPGRALTGRDVSAALWDRPLLRVPWHPSVGRAVDAGTMASRVPQVLRRLERLL